jgi:hypothetical protein
MVLSTQFGGDPGCVDRVKRVKLKQRKDGMKKLLTGLGLVVLLAGCASQDNGMGGTSDADRSMKTDTFNNGNSSDQWNNNATHGTGSSTMPAGANTSPADVP